MDNDKIHLNDPLHGVKLVEILEYLSFKYSWDELGQIINIQCFKNNPSLKSCLKFLRRTPWARKEVEELYIKNIKKPQ
ncbi:MAG: DUF2132 domain-containing protein [Ichthyobacteriaceae bacterium]|nr:DUF2132 domain-containing protein [Ichthyobacteriaceae bacterium]